MAESININVEQVFRDPSTVRFGKLKNESFPEGNSGRWWLVHLRAWKMLKPNGRPKKDIVLELSTDSESSSEKLQTSINAQYSFPLRARRKGKIVLVRYDRNKKTRLHNKGTNGVPRYKYY